MRQILGPESTLVLDQMVVLDTDAATARETARGTLRFLSGVRGFADNFARMGFSENDIADLSDRMVDQLVARGDADTIAIRVGEHLAAGADQVLLSVLSGADEPDPIQAAGRLARSLIA
jgi:probable F420-dependent oxidoreductase